MIVAGMRMETMARITNAEDRLWTVTGMRRGDVWELTVIGTRNEMNGSRKLLGCDRRTGC